MLLRDVENISKIGANIMTDNKVIHSMAITAFIFFLDIISLSV